MPISTPTKSPVNFLNQVINSSYGYTQLFSTDNKFSHYFTRDSLNQLPEYLRSNHNYFFTPNSLRDQKARTNANVKVFNAFFADFDAEKQNYTVDQAYYYLVNSLDDFGLPQPTAIVDSGHGLHLYWSIYPVIVNSPVILLLWKKVETTIIEKINRKSVIKADPKATAPAEIMRLPATNNCKYKEVPVTVLKLKDTRYHLRDLQFELLPKRPNTKRRKWKKWKKSKNIKNGLTNYSLVVARATDIETLVELRNGEMESLRELALFIYANYTAQYADDYAEMVYSLNQNFRNPLTKREIDNKVLKYINDSYYKFKSATLIEWLDIDENEQRQLSSTISRAIKYERNNRRRRQQRQDKKQKRNNQIRSLAAAGLNNSEIAKRLKVSRPTIIKVLKTKA